MRSYPQYYYASDVGICGVNQCAKQPGFVPELLNIIADGTVPEPIGDDDDSEEDAAEHCCLSDEDKNAVKANILNTICEANEASRFKRSKDKEVIAGPVSKIEPLVFYHCNQMLNNQSAEAVIIKKQGLKIIYVLTQLNSIEDREERAHTVWWKCKKWAIKLLDRIFDRYGSPNQVPVSYVVFAKHFLTKWSSSALEVIMILLNAQRNNVYVSDRETRWKGAKAREIGEGVKLYYNGEDTKRNGVAIAVAESLKDHVSALNRDLIRNVLFPLMCYNDDDEEMWEENVEEYIRFKFEAIKIEWSANYPISAAKRLRCDKSDACTDIFEDLHNPVCEAGALLRGLAKRKDIVQPVLAFAINVLTRSTNPREVEGALRMIGELEAQLTKSRKLAHDEQGVHGCDVATTANVNDSLHMIVMPSVKKYKGDVERMLDTLCVNRLSDPNKFVKARAAWCFRQYSDAHFRTTSILSKVLELVAKTQVEDVVRVVDEILEHFMDAVIPIAAEIAESLASCGRSPRDYGSSRAECFEDCEIYIH
ncbi:hypothetical protein TELCIR_03041 [Teladorsagia circumcincta]|uniref:Uncharacterized protein n=1 Tax=Teladorsagia circumcincta TaxID=45464 RepID=A0A2G9UXF0_TELCI|nr:hypothetical protein TELCIR_03041 [Teladorsagia circumcincta]